MSGNRVSSIDFIKGIASLLIVCVHCANEDAFDSVIHLAGRLAVPLFFIITGYFLPTMIGSGRLGKHIRKVARILLAGTVFYLLAFLIEASVRHSLMEQLLRIIDLRHLWRPLLLGKFPLGIGAGHLWYLVSTLYILLFLFWFSQNHPVRNLYPLIPILFLGGYIISSFDTDFSLRPYYQNHVFIGLPYVLLGSFIRERGKDIHLPDNKLCLLTGLFAICYLAEIGLYLLTGIPARREHYLSIIPLVSLILILVARHPDFGRHYVFSTIGREQSICIYIIQFYVAEKVWLLFHGSPLASKLQMLTSIAICLIISFLFSFAKHLVIKKSSALP